MLYRFKRLAPFMLTVMLAAVLAACAPAQSTQAPAATEAVSQAVPPTEAPAQASAPTAAAVATEASPATAISYAKDVQPIFDQNCVTCHGDADGKGGLSLKTYDGLMKGSDRGQVIIPGEIAKSSLVQAVMTGDMPRRASKLSQSAIDTISAWVAAGAQNN